MRGLSTARLLGVHLRAGLGAGLVAAVLVAITAFAAAAVPGALASLTARQLQHSAEGMSAVRRDLTAFGGFGYQIDEQLTGADAAHALDAADERFRDFPTQLGAPLSRVLGAPSWNVITGLRDVQTAEPRDDGFEPVFALALDPQWTTRVRIVDGVEPEGWTGSDVSSELSGERPPIPIAVSADLARILTLTVGEVLGYTPAPLEIAGIYEPLDEDDDYWERTPLLAAATLQPPANGITTVLGDVFVAPASAVGLSQTLSASTVTAWYPIRIDRLDATTGPAVPLALREIEARGTMVLPGADLRLHSGLSDVLDESLARIQLVTALLALAASGPLGVVLAVDAQGAGAILGRRRAALALSAARGASGLQLRAIMALEGLLVGIPAAAIGYLAALALFRGDVSATGLGLAIGFGLAPAVILAVLTSPGAWRGDRADLTVRSRSGARWVAEVAAVGLAAIGVFLLFRRGLAQPAAAVGIDPLLVAVPLLLAVAVCVIVLRIYPALLLLAARAQRRSRGAVALVGSSRAVRSPALGFTAGLALLVGVSIAVFSTGLITTIGTAFTASARDQVGADIRIDDTGLSDDDLARIAGTEGVAAVTGFSRVFTVSLTSGSYGTIVTAYVVDVDAFARIRPDLASALGDGVAVSAAIPTTGDTVSLGGATRPVTGVVPATALPEVGQQWIIVDESDAPLLGPSLTRDGAFVAADPGRPLPALAQQLLALTPAAAGYQPPRVADVTSFAATVAAEPVVGGLRILLLLAALAATLLSVLAIVLGSVSAAEARNRLLGVLRILGMSPRQLGALVAWELAPLALVALVVGTVLGLVELSLVFAALDLRPFLGTTAAIVPAVDPWLVAGVVLAFAAVVLVAGLASAAIARRLSPASSIKMGAE